MTTSIPTGLPLDLTTYSADENQMSEYVVLRGYQPGCTNKLGAIIATHGIEGSIVVRMGSEAAALELWRRELVGGRNIGCLGTMSADQRSTQTEDLRITLLANSFSGNTTKPKAAGKSQKLTPPVKRTDTLKPVPDILRRPSNSINRATEGST